MNKLSVDQLILSQLSEEAGEIVQAVSKMFRFGPEDYHIEPPINKDKLTMEVADLIAVFNRLVTMGVLDDITSEMLKDKGIKIDKYIEISRNLGIIE